MSLETKKNSPQGTRLSQDAPRKIMGVIIAAPGLILFAIYGIPKALADPASIASIFLNPIALLVLIGGCIVLWTDRVMLVESEQVVMRIRGLFPWIRTTLLGTEHCKSIAIRQERNEPYVYKVSLVMDTGERLPLTRFTQDYRFVLPKQREERFLRFSERTLLPLAHQLGIPIEMDHRTYASDLIVACLSASVSLGEVISTPSLSTLAGLSKDTAELAIDAKEALKDHQESAQPPTA